MKRPRCCRSDKWTSTDALLLDVAQVEKWATLALRDGDGSISALVDITTRLRSVADSIASYLFRHSSPVRVRARMRTRAARPHAPRRVHAPEKQGRAADSTSRP